jgi:hypothetical protein
MNESSFTNRGFVHLGTPNNDATVDYNSKNKYYIFYNYKFVSMDVSEQGEELNNIERGLLTTHFHPWLKLPAMVRDINGREYFLQSIDEDVENRRMRCETVCKRME